MSTHCSVEKTHLAQLVTNIGLNYFAWEPANGCENYVDKGRTYISGVERTSSVEKNLVCCDDSGEGHM